MDVAEQHPDDPVVLELSLKIGQLEGIWATIFHRRVALIEKHTTRLVEWMPRVVRALDIPLVVDRVLNHAENVDPVVKGAAGALGGSAMNHLPDDVNSELRGIVHDSLVEGHAEGMADAQALIDDMAGLDVDFDLPFDAGIAALEDLDSLWADATDWLSQLVSAAGNMLGRTLAAGVRDELSRSELIDSVAEVTGQGVGMAAILDLAMSTAVTQGSLATYTENGVEWVDFVSAGDDAVCDDCQADEDGSPYPTDQVPDDPPVHFNCRCTLAPSTGPQDQGG